MLVCSLDSETPSKDSELDGLEVETLAVAVACHDSAKKIALAACTVRVVAGHAQLGRTGNSGQLCLETAFQLGSTEAGASRAVKN